MARVSARATARQKLGTRAEDAAAGYFVEQGYEIVGRNVRVGRLEIDLLLREGPLVIVVEVRTRGPGSWVGSLDSVDHRKRARVRAAGERLWRARLQRVAGLDRMRFDLAAVTLDANGDARVEHIKAAF